MSLACQLTTDKANWNCLNYDLFDWYDFSLKINRKFIFIDFASLASRTSASGEPQPAENLSQRKISFGAPATNNRQPTTDNPQLSTDNFPKFP